MFCVCLFNSEGRSLYSPCLICPCRAGLEAWGPLCLGLSGAPGLGGLKHKRPNEIFNTHTVSAAQNSTSDQQECVWADTRACVFMQDCVCECVLFKFINILFSYCFCVKFSIIFSHFVMCFCHFIRFCHLK